MRLTNQIRDAYIEAVMRDVPTVDYAEKAQALLREEVVKLFEQTFPGADHATAVAEGWLAHHAHYLPHNLGYLYTYGPSNVSTALEAIAEILEEYGRRHTETKQMVRALRDKVRAAAYACTNRKQLAEAIPEFVKYLPAEPSAVIRTLPAVQNVVADFVAAGWEPLARRA